MSRRDRVTRKKGMQRQSGKANVNPKLSAYQKEQKRNKLANQPPIALKNQRDVPSRSRNIADFMAQDKKRREEIRARKYGPKNAEKMIDSNTGELIVNQGEPRAASSNTNMDSTNFRAPLEHGAGNKLNRNYSDKSEVNKAQSLNRMVADSANLDESRVRLDLLQKKAQLRLKKKLRRRAKRSEIEHAQLDRLMSQDRQHNSSAVAGGKKGATSNSRNKNNNSNSDDEEFGYHTDLASNNKNKADEKPIPLTRAEKKKVKEQVQRREAQDEARKVRREKEEKEEKLRLKLERQQDAAASGGGNDDDDEMPVESDDDQEEQPYNPQYDGVGHTDLPSNDDNNKNDDDATSEDDAPWKKSVHFKEPSQIDQPKKKKKTYDESSKKDFSQLGFDYVKYGDRVDAPPVLDVVPSHTLAAALERRSRRISGEENDSNNNNNKNSRTNNNNKGKNNNNNNLPHHSSSSLDKFRVSDTAGQTSISEMASKMVHGGRKGSSDIFQIQQKNKDNNNNNNNKKTSTGGSDFLNQSVSGAKLQGKDDFAALRERVMDSYSKHHPKAFGKARTYTPLQ